MQIIGYDDNLQAIGLLREFEGLVWTTRMFDHSEFSFKTSELSTFRQAKYIGRTDTQEIMLVEKIRFDGQNWEISGRGCTALFEFRSLYYNVGWTSAKNIGFIVDNLIANATGDAGSILAATRALPNYTHAALSSSTLPTITNFTKSWGQLYDALLEALTPKAYGIQVIKYLTSLRSRLVAPEYKPNVVFTVRTKDVLAFERTISSSDYYTHALVAGQGEGLARISTSAVSAGQTINDYPISPDFGGDFYDLQWAGTWSDLDKANAIADFTSETWTYPEGNATYMGITPAAAIVGRLPTLDGTRRWTFSYASGQRRLTGTMRCNAHSVDVIVEWFIAPTYTSTAKHGHFGTGTHTPAPVGTVSDTGFEDMIFPEYRELYVDASQVSNKVQDPTDTETEITLSAPQYIEALKDVGKEKLSAKPYTNTLVVSIDESRYKYGTDWELGSIVGYRVDDDFEGYDIVTEVVETWEQGARSLEVGLGKTAPTLKRIIRR